MFERIFASLHAVRKSGRGWTARCPAHEDRRSSLSVAISDDGSHLLVYCFAGCRPEEIARALGMEVKDFFADQQHHHTDTIDPAARTAARPTLMAARYLALNDERRKDERRAPYRELHAESEAFRAVQRTVSEARVVMTALGECDLAWDVLARAAALETESYAALEREEERVERE